MAKVLLEKLNKHYGKNHVVKDLDLDIEDREFLVLVGPSGCGKSTTLRMVAGLEEVSDGSIYIGDRKVNDLPPKDRRIAMVFQNYALYPHMTAFDNMAFGLKLAKRPKEEIRKKVMDAAAVLGIENLLGRKPKQLSGGQRQRVALGRAIVRDPDVFLFDEPLSNLDAKLRVQMRAEIGKLHRRVETTVIYVTHDQVEAMTMGTRIAVMNEGVLMQAGPPMELYLHPKNRFVAGFIGSPSMNFIEGRIDAGVFKAGSVEIPLSGAARSALAGLGAAPVTFAVRPENVHDAALSRPDGPAALLRGVVETVEPLGPETLLGVRVDGCALVAKTPPETAARVNQPLELAIDSTRIHFFDSATGDALAIG